MRTFWLAKAGFFLLIGKRKHKESMAQKRKEKRTKKQKSNQTQSDLLTYFLRVFIAGFTGLSVYIVIG